MMQVAPSEFLEQIDANKLSITMIGMSNLGKTHWSQALATIGFDHINCDDLIEIELLELMKAKGYTGGIEDVARWMGMPYEDRYAVNQTKFLDIEKGVISRLTSINQPTVSNTIIDTSGSVVHTGIELCKALQNQTLMIYLAASQEHTEKLFEKYIAEPKPVVFENMFQPHDGEENNVALARAYKNLLEERTGLYEKYADVTLHSQDLANISSGEDFLALVAKSL
jgi:shikimate kinase